jgi:hypothetical protein
MGLAGAKPGLRPSIAVRTALACALISLGFKALLLSLDAFPFYADEAIVGLMARHILAGQWPTFFYGQAYLGSTDAALVAGAFALLEEHVEVIRIVQVLLYAGTVMTTVGLASRAGLGTWGMLATGLFMALPVVNTTLYTTVSIGGYGEALLLGNLILLYALKLHRDRPSLGLCLGWGVLSGFAFWTFGLTLVFSLPAIFLLAAQWVRGSVRSFVLRGGAVLAGALAGSTPLIVWAFRNSPGLLVQEMLGSAIAGASSPTFLQSVLAHGLNLILFGPTVVIGARPPWGTDPLALPLLPFAVTFWVVAVFYVLRNGRMAIPDGTVSRLLTGVVATVALGFIFTPFGGDPSGRYFLPLAAGLALVGGAFIAYVRRRRGQGWAAAVMAVPLAFSVWGCLQTARIQPPGITTQFDPAARRDTAHDLDLLAFLQDRGETRGFTTYWISYPLAFLSRESMVFIPRLPYHPDFRYTARDDRYPAYDSLVAASPRVAYITSGQPWLDSFLREAFEAGEIGYSETQIADYHVFHDLSRRVTPTDLGLIER